METSSDKSDKSTGNCEDEISGDAVSDIKEKKLNQIDNIIHNAEGNGIDKSENNQSDSEHKKSYETNAKSSENICVNIKLKNEEKPESEYKAVNEEETKVESVSSHSELEAVNKEAKVESVSSHPELEAVNEEEKVDSVLCHPGLEAVNEEEKVDSVLCHPELEAVNEEGKVESVSSHSELEAVNKEAKVESVSSHSELETVNEEEKVESIPSHSEAEAVNEEEKVDSVVCHPELEAVNEEEKVESVSSHSELEAVNKEAKIESVLSHSELEAVNEEEKVDSILSQSEVEDANKEEKFESVLPLDSTDRKMQVEYSEKFSNCSKEEVMQVVDEEIVSDEIAVEMNTATEIDGLETVVNGVVSSDGDIKEEEKNSMKEEQTGLENTFESKYDGKTCQLPNFAVVYSFLNTFGVFLGLPRVTLLDLEQSIDSTKELAGKEDQGILELLHLKLLRKLSRSPRLSSLGNCQIERLTKSVTKFAHVIGLDFAWDLHQSGYHILSSEQRLTLLKHLCEVQFDENPRFRNYLIEAYKTDQSVLRLVPFGCEKEGLSVWLHEDHDLNIHVYAGEDDDPNGITWKVRVGCLNDMEWYISKLKKQTEVNPKDIAVEEIKVRRFARQLEKERRRMEREERRKEEQRKEEEAKKLVKKGRPRKKKELTPVFSSSSSSEEDDGCASCYENKKADVMLLCDGCDGAYHTLCLRPPVIDIPEDDWYCPFCAQIQLIEKLEKKFTEIKNKIKAKERKSRRLDFYGIRSANIVEQPENGRRLGRAAARRVDYNFTDYDQLISEAVQGGRKTAINFASDSDIIATGNEEPLKEKGKRSAATSQRKRKLNALSSDEYEDTADSEYANSSCDEVNPNDMKNFVVDDNIDVSEERHRNRFSRRSVRNQTQRRSARKRNRYDDDSDFSERSDSIDEKPGMRLRQRNVALYSEQFSDDDDIVIKEEDDGGDWEQENEKVEEEEEEEEEEIYDSDNSSYVGRHVVKERKRSLRARPRKRVYFDDDTDDEEVPYMEESEEEIQSAYDEEEEEKQDESKTSDLEDDFEMDVMSENKDIHDKQEEINSKVDDGKLNDEVNERENVGSKLHIGVSDQQKEIESGMDVNVMDGVNQIKTSSKNDGSEIDRMNDKEKLLVMEEIEEEARKDILNREKVPSNIVTKNCGSLEVGKLVKREAEIGNKKVDCSTPNININTVNQEIEKAHGDSTIISSPGDFKQSRILPTSIDLALSDVNKPIADEEVNRNMGDKLPQSEQNTWHIPSTYHKDINSFDSRFSQSQQKDRRITPSYNVGVNSRNIDSSFNRCDQGNANIASPYNENVSERNIESNFSPSGQGSINSPHPHDNDARNSDIDRRFNLSEQGNMNIPLSHANATSSVHTDNRFSIFEQEKRASSLLHHKGKNTVNIDSGCSQSQEEDKKNIPVSFGKDANISDIDGRFSRPELENRNIMTSSDKNANHSSIDSRFYRYDQGNKNIAPLLNTDANSSYIDSNFSLFRNENINISPPYDKDTNSSDIISKCSRSEQGNENLPPPYGNDMSSKHTVNRFSRSEQGKGNAPFLYYKGKNTSNIDSRYSRCELEKRNIPSPCDENTNNSNIDSKFNRSHQRIENIAPPYITDASSSNIDSTFSRSAQENINLPPSYDKNANSRHIDSGLSRSKQGSGDIPIPYSNDSSMKIDVLSRPEQEKGNSPLPCDKNRNTSNIDSRYPQSREEYRNITPPHGKDTKSSNADIAGSQYEHEKTDIPVPCDKITKISTINTKFSRSDIPSPYDKLIDNRNVGSISPTCELNDKNNLPSVLKQYDGNRKRYFKDSKSESLDELHKEKEDKSKERVLSGESSIAQLERKCEQNFTSERYSHSPIIKGEHNSRSSERLSPYDNLLDRSFPKTQINKLQSLDSADHQDFKTNMNLAVLSPTEKLQKSILDSRSSHQSNERFNSVNSNSPPGEAPLTSYYKNNRPHDIEERTYFSENDNRKDMIHSSKYPLSRNSPETVNNQHMSNPVRSTHRFQSTSHSIPSASGNYESSHLGSPISASSPYSHSPPVYNPVEYSKHTASRVQATTGIPIHPSARLRSPLPAPLHPQSRLRVMRAGTPHQQTRPCAGPIHPQMKLRAMAHTPVRPTPSYPYPNVETQRTARPPFPQKEVTAMQNNPYEYYLGLHRPQSAQPSQFYGGRQADWSQQSFEKFTPDWEHLQQNAGQVHTNSLSASECENPLQERDSHPPGREKINYNKEYKEHMKQLKEHAKQEKEMKKLKKIREKELKKQSKKGPSAVSENNTTKNMVAFKNMVISGAAEGEDKNNVGESYKSYNSSRM